MYINKTKTASNYKTRGEFRICKYTAFKLFSIKVCINLLLFYGVAIAFF